MFLLVLLSEQNRAISGTFADVKLFNKFVLDPLMVVEYIFCATDVAKAAQASLGKLLKVKIAVGKPFGP